MPSRQLTRRQLRLACSVVLAGSFAGFALGQALGRQSMQSMPATGPHSLQTQGGLGVGINVPSGSTPTPTTTPTTTQDGGRTYIPAPSPVADPASIPAHPLASPPTASSQQLSAAPAAGKAAPKHANHGKKGKPKSHSHKDDGHPKAPKHMPAQQTTSGSGSSATGQHISGHPQGSAAHLTPGHSSHQDN